MDEMQQDTLSRLRRDMYGDGNGLHGLKSQHDRMYRDMYANAETGEPGLFADVRHIKRKMDSISAWIKGAAAAVTLGAVSGAAVAIRALFGL